MSLGYCYSQGYFSGMVATWTDAWEGPGWTLRIYIVNSDFSKS